MKAVEGYVAVIITILFVMVIALFIKKEYLTLYEENKKAYHIEQTIWQIEQERCVHLELLEYSFEITCYSKEGDIIRYNPTKYNKFPNNVKYVHIVYGGKSRWIVYA